MGIFKDHRVYSSKRSRIVGSSEVYFSWSILLQLFKNDFLKIWSRNRDHIEDFTVWEVIAQWGFLFFAFLFFYIRNKYMPLNLLSPVIIALWKVKFSWYDHLISNYINLQLKGIFCSLPFPIFLSSPPSSSPPLPFPSLPFLFFKAKS